jgi:uncharacterized repeat protein (TIGR01451 family)
MIRALRLVVIALLPALVLALSLGRAGAAQRSPAWWDPDGVGSGSDWHYRVAVTMPSTSSVNSTGKVDIDFAALMTQLGIAGTFDVNSVRVVRPGGTIATVQEYNDTIYAGATDAVSTRGEVRWIVQDGGVQTYYVYFDITANGAKSTSPQTPINGNFEQSSSGTQLPAGWASATRTNAAYDLQVRPSESVSITSDGNPLNNPTTTDGTPLSGSFSYLLGARTNNEPSNGNVSQTEATRLTRTITVPATNPGNLVVRWRVEGWDSDTNAVTTFDNLHIRVTTSGGTVTEIVGPAAGNYANFPFSPNYGSGAVTTSNPGYGQYNGFDMGTNGSHTQGMTVALHGQGWWTRTFSLSAFAGQTVTFSFGTTHLELFRSWFHLDDIEWSVVSGTLGNAEGFGVAATSPAGSLAPGQVMTITAVVDAKPTAASNPVTADIINGSGTTVASAVKLYNDGTHGDSTANDTTWTNNGSDGANPTYTVPLTSGSTSGWTVRVYAKDASTSTFGNNGMIHRNGLGTALILANWWNIAETSFSVDAASIGVSKTMTVVSDAVNSSNFKAIPGARVQYCVTISNSGTASAATVVGTDTLPGALSYVAGSLKSGADCNTAVTAEDDNATGGDETDPIGASFASSTVSITRSSLATSTSFAVTYQANLN